MISDLPNRRKSPPNPSSTDDASKNIFEINKCKSHMNNLKPGARQNEERASRQTLCRQVTVTNIWMALPICNQKISSNLSRLHTAPRTECTSASTITELTIFKFRLSNKMCWRANNHWENHKFAPLNTNNDALLRFLGDRVTHRRDSNLLSWSRHWHCQFAKQSTPRLRDAEVFNFRNAHRHVPCYRKTYPRKQTSQ